MNNKRLVALGCAVALAAGGPAALAADSRSVPRSSTDGATTATTDVDMYQGGFQWDWKKQWLELGNWHFGGYLGVGPWATGTTAAPARRTPGSSTSASRRCCAFSRRRRARFRHLSEAGVGVHTCLKLRSATDRRFGCNFSSSAITSASAALRSAKRPSSSCYRYQHLSNAGISSPNQGINFNEVRLLLVLTARRRDPGSRPQVAAPNVSAELVGPGARGARADERARPAAAASRLSVDRHARRRQDHARAHHRQGAQLRDRHHGRRRAAVARPAREIDAGRFVDLIELDAASNTQVDNMRELLENALYAPTGGALQGLHHRRSAHAVAHRLQRDAEDAGRAAGARQVHPRDHRSAEDPGDRAVALPAVQPEADSRGADPGAARAHP